MAAPPSTASAARVPPRPTPRTTLPKREQPPPLPPPSRVAMPLRETAVDSATASSADSSRLSTPDSIRIHCTEMISDSSESTTDEEKSEVRMGKGRRRQDVHEYLSNSILGTAQLASFACQTTPSLSRTDSFPSGCHSPSTLSSSRHVSLLEQLIRSHPIWYLQDVTRPAAEHLLHPMPLGTFVVRGSSRAHSMALSVRVPPPGETEHLLLVHAPSHGVRLHSSPHVFRSLPLLLQHYCAHQEELRVLLRLPTSILECKSTAALQGLALMGRDFWQSDLALSPCESRLSHTSSSASLSSASQSRQRPSLPRSRSSTAAARTPAAAAAAAAASPPLSLGRSPDPAVTPTVKAKTSLLSLVDSKARSQLAHCALFLPFRSKPSTSQSALDLGERAKGGDLPRDRSAECISSFSSSTFKPFASRTAFKGVRREQSGEVSAEIGRRMAEYTASPLPPALLPPSDALDSDSLRGCIEELRRKRLQSAEELLGSGTAEGCGPTLLRRKKKNGDESVSSLRSHRLSAPSLPEAIPSPAAYSARALKQRMPTEKKDGELSTINEGLVTPVIRRKAHEKSPCEEEVLRGVQTAGASQGVATLGRRFHSERVRHSTTVSRQTPVAVPSASSTHPPSSAPPRTLIRPANDSVWSAINTELRSRQQKIAKVLPTPKLRPPMTAEEGGVTAASAACRHSEYAQLVDCAEAAGKGDDDAVSLAATVFDEPWDSNTWDNLLVCAGEGEGARLVGQDTIAEADSEGEEEGGGQRMKESLSLSRMGSRYSLLSADLGFCASLRRPGKVDSASSTIQQYVAYLATAGGTFSKSLDRFFICTKESTEKDPRVVAKAVRQFMNGMKNYLVKAGEGDLHALIQRESSRLDSHHCLNIDATLEAVLCRLVLKPLCPHVYAVLRAEQRQSGSLLALFSGMERAKCLSPLQLGLPPHSLAPSGESLERLRSLCRRMQQHFSPHRKLEYLLKAVRLMLDMQPQPAAENEDPAANAARAARLAPPPADELIRWLVWFIPRTLSVGCECEATFMTELLPAQVRLSGNAAFYLTALDSAIRILSTPDAILRLSSSSSPDHPHSSPHRPSASGFSSHGECLVRVAVPDEALGCVHYESFPLVAEMQAGQLCRLVAHQHSITNAHDYGLYLLVDGFETALPPSESIEGVREQMADKAHILAYKRHEARIAWPRISCH